jgi:hypothetical protein
MMKLSGESRGVDSLRILDEHGARKRNSRGPFSHDCTASKAT